MSSPTMHQAEEFDDDLSTACGKNVGHIFSDTDDDITTIGPEEFLFVPNYCVDCALALDLL